MYRREFYYSIIKILSFFFSFFFSSSIFLISLITINKRKEKKKINYIFLIIRCNCLVIKHYTILSILILYYLFFLKVDFQVDYYRLNCLVKLWRFDQKKRFHPRRDTHTRPVFPRSFVTRKKSCKNREQQRQPSTIISRFVSPRFPFDFPAQLTDVKAIHVDLLALFPIFHVSLSPIVIAPILRGIVLYAPSCDSRVCNFHSVELVIFTFNFIFTFSLFLNLRKKQSQLILLVDILVTARHCSVIVQLFYRISFRN